jgi:hypothetical protein
LIDLFVLARRAAAEIERLKEIFTPYFAFEESLVRLSRHCATMKTPLTTTFLAC